MTSNESTGRGNGEAHFLSKALLETHRCHNPIVQHGLSLINYFISGNRHASQSKVPGSVGIEPEELSGLYKHSGFNSVFRLLMVGFAIHKMTHFRATSLHLGSLEGNENFLMDFSSSIVSVTL